MRDLFCVFNYLFKCVVRQKFPNHSNPRILISKPKENCIFDSLICWRKNMYIMESSSSTSLKMFVLFLLGLLWRYICMFFLIFAGINDLVVECWNLTNTAWCGSVRLLHLVRSIQALDLTQCVLNVAAAVILVYIKRFFWFKS